MVYRVQAKPGQPIRSPRSLRVTTRRVECRLVEFSPTAAGETLDRVHEHGVEPNSPPNGSGWTSSGSALMSGSGQPGAAAEDIRVEFVPDRSDSQSAPSSHGVPAERVTGTGYSGHYFRDTEIYVVPFLTYTSPQMARSETAFPLHHAARTLRQPALRSLHQSGALFLVAVRSTARRHRPITRPALRSTTSTPTSRLRPRSKYVDASGDQDFLTSRRRRSFWSRPPGYVAGSRLRRANGPERRSFHIHARDRTRRVHRSRQRQPLSRT